VSLVPEGLYDGSQAIYCLGCVQKGDPSRRDGVNCASGPVNRLRFEEARSNHTVPYGTELILRDTRHFVPGYLHLVPPGQKPSAHVYIFDSTSGVGVDDRQETPLCSDGVPEGFSIRVNRTQKNSQLAIERERGKKRME
jgi:hypothetical protein